MILVPCLRIRQNISHTPQAPHLKRETSGGPPKAPQTVLRNGSNRQLRDLRANVSMSPPRQLAGLPALWLVVFLTLLGRGRLGQLKFFGQIPTHFTVDNLF